MKFKPHHLIASLCLLAFATNTPAAGQPATKRLAVLEFQGNKVRAETLTTFSDAVRSGALEGLARTGIDVMTRENMLALLKDMGKGECSEGECEVETARNIGADYVVSGIVTNIEGKYVVTLKLHESRAGSLLGTDLVKAKTQLEILDALHARSQALIQVHIGRSSGPISVSEKRIETNGDFATRDDRVLVQFESEPPGATVLLDGDLLCKETPCSRSVAAGSHSVEMQKERYDRSQQLIEARKGFVAHLVLPANFATLVVATAPSGLSISLDGTPQDPRTSTLEVMPGPHEVLINHPCFQPSGERVVLKKNDRRELRLTASPRQSAIAVTALNERGDEIEAKVSVDGISVGTTPGTFKVGLCSKEVLVTAGSAEFRSPLVLTEKAVAAVRARLQAAGRVAANEAGPPPPNVQPSGPSRKKEILVTRRSEEFRDSLSHAGKAILQDKARRQTGPVLKVEQFVESQPNRATQIPTTDQIANVAGLARNALDDDPQKPDYLFLLGDLYAETRRNMDFTAHDLDSKIAERQSAGDSGQASQLRQKQQQYQRASDEAALNAVKSYVAASQYRKYNRLDEVLFRLAYLLQMIKKEEQAREFLHKLIKDYPSSKYVPDAYLAFAEFYFQKGEMENAGKFYQKVEQFPQSSVFGFALYKQGWVEINLGNFKSALEIFVKVIQLCQNGKIPKNQAGPLEKEAKKDLVKAYGRTPGASPAKAWDFFQRMGGDYAPKMMESLAELYWEQGLFPESSQLYRKIITLNENSPRLCEWQNKILRNTLLGGNKKDQMQEIRRLGNVYEAMVKNTEVKKDVMGECKNTFHDTSEDLALDWHREAQRTRSLDTYQLAGVVYKEFLSHFNQDKDAPEITFFYSETLWQIGSWKDAAENYTKVVELDRRGKYVKEAAYAAVLAWNNALQLDDSGEVLRKTGSSPKSKEKGLNMRAIPEYQQKMLSASDTYIMYVPDAPELLKIKYRKALVFYDSNHFEDAINLFAEIIDRYVNDDLAISSAGLLLDCLSILKRYDDLLATAEEYLRNPVLGKDQGLRKQVMKARGLALKGKTKQSDR